MSVSKCVMYSIVEKMRAQQKSCASQAVCNLDLSVSISSLKQIYRI